jgi:hypothetical protein
MPLSLIQEDGSAMVDANSYACVDDGDAYFLGHLYPAPWAEASADSKAAALVMATRLIDAYCEFLGFRKSDSQALQWPRVQVPDREASGVFFVPGMMMGAGPMAPQYLSSNTVPQCVIDATCELARELLLTDRTAAPQGEGLKSSAVSGSTFVFDKLDRRPVLTPVVEALLCRVLAGSPGKSMVRLVRC